MTEPAIYFTTHPGPVGGLYRMWIWCRDSIGRFVPEDVKAWRVTYASDRFVDMRAADDNARFVTLTRDVFDRSFERA